MSLKIIGVKMKCSNVQTPPIGEEVLTEKLFNAFSTYLTVRRVSTSGIDFLISQ